MGRATRNMLVRWSIGQAMDEPPWDVTMFAGKPHRLRRGWDVIEALDVLRPDQVHAVTGTRPQMQRQMILLLRREGDPAGPHRRGDVVAFPGNGVSCYLPSPRNRLEPALARDWNPGCRAAEERRARLAPPAAQPAQDSTA